jgi:hypothetical protein
MTTDPPRDATHVDDETNTRLDKEMRAVKTAMGSLSQQIADAASDLGAVVGTQARRGLKRSRKCQPRCHRRCQPYQRGR